MIQTDLHPRPESWRQRLSEWIGNRIQKFVQWLVAWYAKPKQTVLEGLNKSIKHDVCTWETAIFCEACADCIRCYGEDPCQNSRDGIHTMPTDEEML